MTIVLGPSQSVQDLVAVANRSCPGCGGGLRKWGSAKWRVVRDAAGDRHIRPERVRCASCGVTHVVLPPEVLVRRRDAMARIGEGWRLFAAGAGARRTSQQLRVPMQTVRGWLRRLKQRAALLFGPSQGDDRDRLGWSLAFVVAEAHRAGWQSEDHLWRFVAYRSEGRLLSNTSWP